ncbi:MAG: hypothetical protein VYD75_10030 [Pseudomonadota bacterium]|nr:hypothetical protein [Pseudomonadota bacterium]
MTNKLECYEDDTSVPCSTLQEDQFMYMNKGDLISEILQIAACLKGSVERTETLDSMGRSSKKIIIEYDVETKGK